MYLIVIAWTYVVLLMSLAEALSPQGTVLGAFITLVLYGVLPLSIVMYILGTPSRKRARARADALAQEEAAAVEASALEPDQGRHASGAAEHPAVPSVRKEP